MKKIVMSAALLALPLAFAEDAVVEHNEVAVEQEHAAYEGFYFGLGVHAANVGEKNEYTYGTYYAGWQAPLVPTNSAGYTENELNDSVTRLGGYLVLGFGKKMKTNRAYLGIEAGLDFSQNANQTRYGSLMGNGRLMDLVIRRNGFVPSLALRLGFVDCETKIMTYIKAGGSYAKSKELYAEWNASDAATTPIAVSENKVSKITPIVALGVEKAFAKKMTGRLEVEYKFNTSKSKDFGDRGSTKLTQKDAITLRAMFCYNVKI